ncbi:MAG: rhamnan synthesis F family protein, partial [Bacteroidales bacterium]|nr:rhamnan synthesis F family protein [Bacteroidales bacterium]
KQNLSLNIAVHIHVYYIDIFEKIIDHLIRANINFELFVTTDNEHKKANVVKCINARNLSGSLKKIQLFENRGRDVLPWLSLVNELSQYDIIGHFHTKKTSWADAWIGESWMDDIIELLIDPGQKIVNQFEINDKLGIVIPDIPFYYKTLLEADTWAGNRKLIEDILMKIKLKKKVEIGWSEVPVMPYGNMFWYRPNALKPLSDIGLTVNDFSEEPLKVDGTIAHALERLPVYVAWGQGYDFRIAVRLENGVSGFDFFVNSKVAERFATLHNSNSYKIGKIITWLPSKIKAYLGMQD